MHISLLDSAQPVSPTVDYGARAQREFADQSRTDDVRRAGGPPGVQWQPKTRDNGVRLRRGCRVHCGCTNVTQKLTLASETSICIHLRAEQIQWVSIIVIKMSVLSIWWSKSINACILWFPSTRWVDCSWKSSVEFYEGVSKLTVNDEINRQNILTIKY